MKLTHKRPTVPSLGGLPATRHGAVLLALVCAIVAGLILLFAVGQYRHSASTATKQDTVLVATGLIQKGITGDAIAADRLYKSTPVQQSHVAPGAISNAAQLSGSVTANQILPGQQLTAADFVAGGGIPTELSPTERAVSVALDNSHGLLDVLQAGDRVDIYAGFTLQNTGSNPVPVNRLLIPDALVLKAPGGTAGLAASGTAGANVILEVMQNQVPTLAFAADNGKIWLALRAGSADTPNADITSLDSILFGTQPNLGKSAAGTTVGGVTIASAAPYNGAPGGTTTTTSTAGSHR